MSQSLGDLNEMEREKRCFSRKFLSRDRERVLFVYFTRIHSQRGLIPPSVVYWLTLSKKNWFPSIVDELTHERDLELSLVDTVPKWMTTILYLLSIRNQKFTARQTHNQTNEQQRQIQHYWLLIHPHQHQNQAALHSTIYKQLLVRGFHREPTDTNNRYQEKWCKTNKCDQHKRMAMQRRQYLEAQSQSHINTAATIAPITAATMRVRKCDFLCHWLHCHHIVVTFCLLEIFQNILPLWSRWHKRITLVTPQSFQQQPKQQQLLQSQQQSFLNRLNTINNQHQSSETEMQNPECGFDISDGVFDFSFAQWRSWCYISAHHLSSLCFEISSGG